MQRHRAGRQRRSRGGPQKSSSSAGSPFSRRESPQSWSFSSRAPSSLPREQSEKKELELARLRALRFVIAKLKHREVELTSLSVRQNILLFRLKRCQQLMVRLQRSWFMEGVGEHSHSHVGAAAPLGTVGGNAGVEGTINGAGSVGGVVELSSPRRDAGEEDDENIVLHQQIVSTSTAGLQPAMTDFSEDLSDYCARLEKLGLKSGFPLPQVARVVRIFSFQAPHLDESCIDDLVLKFLEATVKLKEGYLTAYELKAERKKLLQLAVELDRRIVTSRDREDGRDEGAREEGDGKAPALRALPSLTRALPSSRQASGCRTVRVPPALRYSSG